MSQHFLEYRRASYDLIMEAESRTGVALDGEVEAWTVHTFARYLDQPRIPTDTIAIRMLTAMGEVGELRKLHLTEIASECILIDGLGLNARRWPSPSYYRDTGVLACEARAWTDRPPELFWERLAHDWCAVTRVLNTLRA